jgi:hypothetical protein
MDGAGAGAGLGGGECSVCRDAFNASTRRRVTCAHCPGDACLACVKQYAIVTDDPVCTLCSHPWSLNFLDSVVPRAFLENEYRLKREQVLLERELAQLPATQGLARMEIERRDVARQCEQLKTERRALTARLNDVNAHITRLEDRAWHLGNVVAGVEPMPDEEDGPGARMDSSSEHEREREAERRAFVRRCPVDGCTGFLGARHVCGMCGSRACRECHAVVSLPGQDHAAAAAAHVCDPDAAASARLIASECKPCPKCAAPVYKVDGCDQMWCTQCHTAFCWRTGRVETGRIHNPHWCEWQQQQRGEDGCPPPGAGAGQGGIANDVPSLFFIPRHLRMLPWVGPVHRLLTHVAMHTVPRLLGHAYHPTDNSDLRIAFLLKEVDEGRLKRLLQQRERRRRREMAIQEALEALVTMGGPLLAYLRRSSGSGSGNGNGNGSQSQQSAHEALSAGHAPLDPEAVHARMRELRAECNDQLASVARRFACKAMRIDDEWRINDGFLVA